MLANVMGSSWVRGCKLHGPSLMASPTIGNAHGIVHHKARLRCEGSAEKERISLLQKTIDRHCVVPYVLGGHRAGMSATPSGWKSTTQHCLY